MKFPEIRFVPVLPKLRPITLPSKEPQVLDKLYIAFPVIVLFALVPVVTIPLTEARLVEELLALATVKLLIVLFVMVLAAAVVAIPLISPATEASALVVPLVRLAIMLLFKVRIPPVAL